MNARRLMLLVLIAVAVVGCGGTSVHHSTTTSTSTIARSVPAQHPCTPNNWYMQCAKNAPGQTPSKVSPIRGLSIFGVDSYGATNPGLPAGFDCSYLSGSPGGKDWTRGGIAAWTGRGKKVCFVWETYANRAEYGYGSGQQDAIRARSEMASLGVPTYVPIRFAVDTETSAAAVASYFQGVKSIIGIRTGVYGSYYVVAGLESRGITTPQADWQTVAWSYGNRSRACLYQSSINHYLSGYSVDYDYASCANWGQYPYNYKPQIICFGKNAQGNATCRKIHADVAKWLKASAASKRVYEKRGCVNLVKLRNSLNQRWNWFWLALRQHPNVKTAYRKRALSATGKAVDHVRRVITGRSCNVFSDRVVFFNGQIAKVKKQYG